MGTKRSKVRGLALEHSEIMALEEACGSYISVCKRKMAEGSMIPFAQDVEIIGRLQERMQADAARAFREMVAAAAKSFES
jgi:hypothetical protein